ncbi:MAG: hypothetical protein QOD86_1844 [Miltoncostaeaceae bacterium]|nr:hypothetical protein [Miltoncostaeaceae bacterium]
MLGSITPLGERGRQARWAITVGAYLLGSTAAGTALGALAGLLGSVAIDGLGTTPRLGILAAAALVGALLDSGRTPLRLPTVRRQVDDAWMRAYRGWVYGLGFGLQLGLGVVTIVTSATVYLTFLAAFLAGGPGAGALVGLVFGAARGLPLLAVKGVRTPRQLGAVEARLRRLEPHARRLALGAQLALVAALPIGLAAA